jgi:hypothetical protein
MGKYNGEIYRCITCNSNLKMVYGEGESSWELPIDPNTGKVVWDGKWDSDKHQAYIDNYPRIVCSKNKEHEVGFLQFEDYGGLGFLFEEPTTEIQGEKRRSRLMNKQEKLNKVMNRTRAQLFSLIESILPKDQAESAKRIIKDITQASWAKLTELIKNNEDEKGQ